MRKVDDDEFGCFPFPFPFPFSFPFSFFGAGPSQLGPKTFITGGLELDSPEVEPRDGAFGPFREAHSNLCCFLFFRSPTVSLSGSVQETSNMMSTELGDQHQDYTKKS